MSNKVKYLLIAIGILLVLGVGVGFAYFVASANQTGEGVSSTGTSVTLEDTIVEVEGNLVFNNLDIYPGHKNVSSIRVTATGDQNALYNLVWEGTNTINTPLNYTVYKTTSEQNPSITCEKVIEGTPSKIYYETCTENNFTNLGEIVSSGTIQTTSSSTQVRLIRNEELQATSGGATVYYYVVLEYPNLDESQNIDINGSFNGEVSIVLLSEPETTKEVNTTLLGTIRVNLDEPNFNNTSCTNGSNNGGNCGEETVGIYEETTSKGTTYYWRGDVDNNYLVFADKYWRIIRINEDGTLRIIYSGEKATIDSAGKETVLANGYNDGSTDYTQTQTSAFNSSYNRSEYVGYRYTSGSQRPSSTSTGTNSTIKGILETWYSNNLQSYDSKIASSSSAGFCNDRNLRSTEGSWVSTGSTQYYAAYERRSNGTPSFECSNSNDLYTTKIGLITADEVMYAGAAGTTSNYGYYLYTGNYYWTMSPYYFFNGFAYVFTVNSTGGLNHYNVNNTWGVRPVISLSTNNTITGSGTINDPYVVTLATDSFE